MYLVSDLCTSAMISYCLWLSNMAKLNETLDNQFQPFIVYLIDGYTRG